MRKIITYQDIYKFLDKTNAPNIIYELVKKYKNNIPKYIETFYDFDLYYVDRVPKETIIAYIIVMMIRGDYKSIIKYIAKNIDFDKAKKIRKSYAHYNTIFFLILILTKANIVKTLKEVLWILRQFNITENDPYFIETIVYIAFASNNKELLKEVYKKYTNKLRNYEKLNEQNFLKNLVNQYSGDIETNVNLYKKYIRDPTQYFYDHLVSFYGNSTIYKILNLDKTKSAIDLIRDFLSKKWRKKEADNIIDNLLNFVYRNMPLSEKERTQKFLIKEIKKQGDYHNQEILKKFANSLNIDINIFDLRIEKLEYKKCNNKNDYITLEEWDEDLRPEFKILFFDPYQEKIINICFLKAGLLEWINTEINHIQNWVIQDIYYIKIPNMVYIYGDKNEILGIIYEHSIARAYPIYARKNLNKRNIDVYYLVAGPSKDDRRKIRELARSIFKIKELDPSHINNKDDICTIINKLSAVKDM